MTGQIAGHAVGRRFARSLPPEVDDGTDDPSGVHAELGKQGHWGSLEVVAQQCDVTDSVPWDPPLALALAVYRFPDADTPLERRMIQVEAANEIRRYYPDGVS